MFSALCLSLALLGGLPDGPAASVPAPELAAKLAAEARTGSLLFSEGDCLAVKTFTCSPVTHVAVVVFRQGEPMVYDSTGSKGTRCQPLATYLTWVGEHPVTAVHPRKPLSDEQGAALEARLDQDLGRPYAIAHHLTGERCEGIHCAEYATDGLVAAGLIRVKQAPRVSPASLATGLLEHELYSVGSRVVVHVPSPTQSSTGSWCRDCWNDTVTCTSGCWRKLKGMVLCQ